MQIVNLINNYSILFLESYSLYTIPSLDFQFLNNPKPACIREAPTREHLLNRLHLRRLSCGHGSFSSWIAAIAVEA